tara:strand:+ start:610 stop:996 length:387 start_codon:yes stop_codon:yes gene_type:complete
MGINQIKELSYVILKKNHKIVNQTKRFLAGQQVLKMASTNNLNKIVNLPYKALGEKEVLKKAILNLKSVEYGLSSKEVKVLSEELEKQQENIEDFHQELTAAEELDDASHLNKYYERMLKEKENKKNL